MTRTGTTARADRIRVEQGAKRVRAYLGGEVVADTIHPRMVWEVPYYPAYYFPVVDVRTDLLVENGGVAIGFDSTSSGILAVAGARPTTMVHGNVLGIDLTASTSVGSV